MPPGKKGQRMNSNETLPVKIDIIGGYLGAGKTTFLNKLVRDGLGASRVAIVENEFGQEPVDDAVIENPGFSMRTLASGCICCSLKVGFMDCIADIVAECQPDRILIEPTGLASPAELERTCELTMRMKGLVRPVRVNSMTAIVDATDAVEMIDFEIPVYMSQIEQARLIVLSHTQELDAAQLNEAVAAIREHAKPQVRIITEPWDSLDALEVLALSEQAYADDLDHAEDADDHDHDHDHDHAHDHGHGHHHSHEGFSSVVLKPQGTFDSQTVERLNAALREQGTSRAKGFLPSPDGGLLHFEYVNGRSTAEPTHYEGPAKLIVIGMHVDAAALAFVEDASRL